MEYLFVVVTAVMLIAKYVGIVFTTMIAVGIVYAFAVEATAKGRRSRVELEAGTMLSPCTHPAHSPDVSVKLVKEAEQNRAEKLRIDRWQEDRVNKIVGN